MTTSTSNASVALRPQGHAGADAAPLAAGALAGGGAGVRGRAADAAPPHTLWSRFIILLLCLALVLSTLAFGTVHPWSLAIFQAGAGLVVALWMVDAWRSRSLRLSRNFLQWPLAGLFVVGLVQLLPLGSAANLPPGATPTISLDPYATRFALIQILSLIIYFAAALAFIDTPKRLRLVVRTVIIFGFCLALFGLMQFFINPNSIFWVRELKQAQPFGPYVNRHHFAGYMELALAIPLGLLFSGAIERDRVPLYAFTVILMSIALVSTNSRGGMLSLVAEILFLVMVSFGTSRARGGGEGEPEDGRVRAAAKRVLLGFSIIAAIFFGVLFFGGEESLSRLVGTVNADDPTTGRTHFWSGTLDIIRDHPVLGTGLGAFSLAYTRYDTRNGQMRLEQAHNDYLQILSDAGIVGALLALVFVVALFRMGFRRAATKDKFRRGVALGALAGCFAVLVHSFFDFTLHTTANALLFLVLAALATLNGRVEDSTKVRGRRRRRHRSAGADTVNTDERALRGDVGRGEPNAASAAGETGAT
jgi:O-antigen ligase